MVSKSSNLVNWRRNDFNFMGKQTLHRLHTHPCGVGEDSSFLLVAYGHSLIYCASIVEVSAEEKVSIAFRSYSIGGLVAAARVIPCCRRVGGIIDWQKAKYIIPSNT